MSVPWKTVRVFISSTFRDMQAERDHLVRFVFPRLREQLLAQRIHLLDVDLRWGVTSEQDAYASEVCLGSLPRNHRRMPPRWNASSAWKRTTRACPNSSARVRLDDYRLSMANAVCTAHHTRFR